METMIRPPRTGMEAFEIMPEGTLCQLINDAIIMSPAPSTSHAIVQGQIFGHIFNFLKIQNLGIVFFSVVDVYLNNMNAYQPDIFFVLNARKAIIERRGIFGAPDLVFEILSYDRNYDLVKKKKVYEQSGVKEYWVVDPDTKWCEGFVLENGKFHSVGETTGHLNVRLFNLEITF